MKLYTALSLLFSLVLPASTAYSQIKNGNFEMWDTTYTALYEQYLISDFNVPDPASGVASAWEASSGYGVCRTTDSYDSLYAIIIHNWYSYAKTTLIYKDSISSRPYSLTGAYKYIEDDYGVVMATGSARVLLKKNNGDTVAYNTFTFDTSSVYKFFEIEFSYISNDLPDSIHIQFKNSELSCSDLFTNVCNLLYLDNIGLTVVTGILQTLPENAVADVYPNPTSDYLHLDNIKGNYEVQIYNIQGKLVYSNKNINKVNVMDLNTGMYFLKIKSKTKEITKKIIKTPSVNRSL